MLAFATTLLAQPVFALSCVPPDARADFKAVDASPDNYVVVHGKISYDQTKLRAYDHTDPMPESQTIGATFTGNSLNSRGFVTPFNHTFALTFSCLGSWCGQLSSGANVLAFMRQKGDAYDLAVGPCGGVYVDPKPKTLRQMQSCLNGGACNAPRY